MGSLVLSVDVSTHKVPVSWLKGETSWRWEHIRVGRRELWSVLVESERRPVYIEEGEGALISNARRH